MTTNQFSNGYALIIAVNENRIPAYALPAVGRDAMALRDVLVHPQRCAYPAANVRLLLGSAATRAGIRDGLSWLRERLAADAGGDATAVLFYSGHGVYSPAERAYYLLPYDAATPLAPSLLPAADLAAEIEQVQPRRLLVAFDCCHAGGLGLKGDPLADESHFHKAAAPAEARPIAALRRGQGRAVLSSSTADESSYIRADRRMSIFTYHLVEALTGHGQPDGATEVLVSDVMGYVSRAVPRSARAAYNVSQTPVYAISGENFPVALALGGAGVGKGQPPPDPLAPLPAAPAQQLTVHTGGGAFVSGGALTAGGDIHLGANFAGGNAAQGAKNGRPVDAPADEIIDAYFARAAPAFRRAPLGDTTRAELNGLTTALQLELAAAGDQAAEARTVARKLADAAAALADGDDEVAAIHGRALARAAALVSSRPAVGALGRQIAAAIAPPERGPARPDHPLTE